MIYVRQIDEWDVAVKFIPVKQNLDRIKKIPDAEFDGNDAWLVPLDYIQEFEDAFKGEIIYITPRHILFDEDPPPPPKIYSQIPKEPINDFKLSLYDYQSYGANFLAYQAKNEGHAFLTDRVGSGKTATSIAAGHILQDQGLVDSVMVFCKASLKYQWLRDGVHKFTNDTGIVIDGTKKQREKLYEEYLNDTSKRYIFVNYELLLHDFDLMKEVIEKRGIKLIIADEAHRLFNHKGKQNNALKALVQPVKNSYPGVPYIFYLTATPMASRIEQIYGLWHIRRPDFFGKFTNYSKRYLKYTYDGRRARLAGGKNLDELREKIQPVMLRRTDAEIDMELPEMIKIPEQVPMTPLQKKLDQRALELLERAEMRLSDLHDKHSSEEEIEQAEGMVKAFMYVRKAISNTPLLLPQSNSNMIREEFGSIVKETKGKIVSPKLEFTLELVEEVCLESGEKMIIFSELETMVRLLESEINKMGVGYATYTGRHSTKEKDEQIQKFKEDDNVSVLIATDAATEGLNLQFARYMVHYDLPWNPDRLEQRNGRIQRGGSSHKTVTVYTLATENSIDIAIQNGLEKKQDLFDALVENTDEQSKELRRVMYGE